MKRIFNFLFIILIVFSLSFFTTGCINTNEKTEEVVEESVKALKISYSKLNEIVNNYSEYANVDVIDIRSEEEYEDGHIIGSMNIPYEHLDEIIISTDREIIVYGANSSKSRQAANELITLGYEKVKYITGINNWPYDLEN